MVNAKQTKAQDANFVFRTLIENASWRVERMTAPYPVSKPPSLPDFHNSPMKLQKSPILVQEKCTK
jgi:hypothetical protein